MFGREAAGPSVGCGAAVAARKTSVRVEAAAVLRRCYKVEGSSEAADGSGEGVCGASREGMTSAAVSLPFLSVRAFLTVGRSPSRRGGEVLGGTRGGR